MLRIFFHKFLRSTSEEFHFFTLLESYIQRFWSELQLATMQCCYFEKHHFFSTASVFASIDYNTVDYIIQHHCGYINLAACVHTNHRPAPVIQIGETRSVCANSGRVEPVNTNFVPGPVNTNLVPGPVNTNGEPGPVNTSWGPSKGPGAGKYKYPKISSIKPQLMEEHVVRKLAYSANLCYCMILIKRLCTYLFVNVI